MANRSFIGCHRAQQGALVSFTAAAGALAIFAALDYWSPAANYHGDLHTENIIVKPCSLGFELKLLDLFYWRASHSENIHTDVIDLIHVFYESLGAGGTMRVSRPRLGRFAAVSGVRCCGKNSARHQTCESISKIWSRVDDDPRYKSH